MKTALIRKEENPFKRRCYQGKKTIKGRSGVNNFHSWVRFNGTSL